MIVPFMTDQPFWARRVHAVSVATKPILVKQLSVEELTRAIAEATTHVAGGRAQAARRMIRGEDGVSRAVELIESHVRNWNERAIF